MPSQKIAGLRTQDDVHALIRCLVGRRDEDDLEKAAVIGGLASKLLKWTVKNPLKAAFGGFYIGSETGTAFKRGRSAAIKPTGYHPISGYYMPEGRVS